MEFIKFTVQEMRIKQWIKNFFVYSALIFGGNFLDFEKFSAATVIFMSFCLTCSGIYYVNDIFDAKIDRLNPEKCNRPIASGKISLPIAIVESFILILSGLILSTTIRFDCCLALISYVIINFFYTLKLKHLVIIDVMIIAYGFVIRTLTGAIAIDSNMTAWFLICVMFLSILLALGKRRKEFIIVSENSIQEGRKVLRFYNLDLINSMMTIVSSSLIVSYSLFIMDEKTKNREFMIFTIIPVLYGIFYYLYIVHVKKEAGSPTDMIYKEKPILITVLIYISYVVAVRNFL